MSDKLLVSHGTCPSCGHKDCYSEWESGGSHCHSCGEQTKGKTSDSNPLADSHKTSLSKYRDLNQQVIDKYQVSTHFDSEGKEFKREYSYPHMSKFRVLPKDFTKNFGFKADHLYGMDKFNAGSSKNLTIVEGEDDTHAAWQMLGGTTPVVGLPSATISADLLKKCHDYISSFDSIIIATDNDDAGDKAASRLAAAFYDKNVYRVQLTKYNDPMEYLQNKDVNEFKFAWANKVKFVPDFDTSTPDGYLKLIEEEDDDEYIPTGFIDYDREHLGLFQGHVTMFLAPEGTGKCLHPDQRVLLSSGKSSPAKDVKKGMRLLGPDGTSRIVLSTTSGQEGMYQITPTKGTPWVCNASHILSLVHSVTGEVTNISVKEYLKESPDFKRHNLQYRANLINSFDHLNTKGVYDPYVVGAYLGDGHTHRCAVSLGPKKKETMDYLVSYFKDHGYKINLVPSTGCTEVQVSNGWKRDSFWSYIKEFVEEERKVPEDYKFSHYQERALLLAGLLDTDGSISSKSGAEITQKSNQLAEDICFIARSLGLAAYKKEKIVSGKTYYRVSISGNLKDTIPTKRLVFSDRLQKKSTLRTGIKVTPLGEGSYCGFTLDGDSLFLLEDFTVTHNTELFHYFEHHLIKNHPDVPFATCHLEETKRRTLLGWVSYDLNKNVTRKDLIRDPAEVNASVQRLTENEQAHLFKIGTDEDPLVILDRIKYYANVCGCKYVFLEPIQDLAQQYYGPDSTERFLSKIAVNLARIASELGIGIVLIGHQNDEGLVSDCRKLSKQASVVVHMVRDMEAKDPIEKNTTRLYSKKNRPTAHIGFAGELLFNPDTFTIKEKE